MCIKKICLLFTIFTVTTVLCTQDQELDEFHQRYIQMMNKTTNHSNDDKIPGVISLDMKSLDTTDVVTVNNLTARPTTLPEMTMGSKFKKKISQLKQINDDKKSIDLINSSANTSTRLTNETKFLKISNMYTHDNNNNNNNNSVKNLDKPITMTTIITTVNNINDDDNNNKTLPSIANLNSTEKVLNSSTIKTFETNFSRARALDIPASPSDPTNSLNANLTDLSDVSMDEEDKQIEGGEYIATHHNESHIKILPIIFTSEPKCIEPNNKTYLVGETIVRGCTEKCICGYNGTAENCQPICKSPLVRAIGKSQDPFCHKRQIDNNECCAILICSSVNYDFKSPESAETCNFIGNDNENKTITIGEHIEDGCSRICTCQVGGVLNCKPRCPLVVDDDNNNNNKNNNNDNNNNDDDDEKSHKANLKMNNYDRCVKLKDPRDQCCTITYCDVSIDEHDDLTSAIDDDKVTTTTKTINNFNDGILNDTKLINDQVKVLNSTAIKILLSQGLLNNNKTIIEISKNNHTWKQQTFNKEGIISNLEPSSIYYIRIKTDGKNNNNNYNKTISTVGGIVALPATEIKINKNKSNNGTIIKMNNDDTCSYRGNLYKIGTEWYDECIYFCVCEKGAKTECVTIECPTDFGLDVLDPNCIDWETVPLNFVPKAPQCCPEEVRCRNNGSCIYQGITYDNWSEIPNNITGCDKRCYCEMGKVSCQPACPPIPALPPDTLSCISNQAILTKLPDDECCLHWTCGNENNNNNYHTSISDDTMSSVGPLTITDIVSNDMKKNRQSSVIANDNNGKKKLNNKTTISISKLTLAKEIENSKDNDDYGAGIDVKLLHKNYTKLSSTHSQHHAPNNSDTINYFTSNEYSIARPTEIKKPTYNGPYNPDYKLPELGNFDKNLRLNNNNDNNINKNNHGQSEIMISPLIIKDKFLKSKLSEIKKKNESANQAYYHNKTKKEEEQKQQQQQQQQQVMPSQSFPGPLAPDKFPTLPSLLPTIIVTSNNNFTPTQSSKDNATIDINPMVIVNNFDNKSEQQFYPYNREKISSSKLNKYQFSDFNNTNGIKKQVLPVIMSNNSSSLLFKNKLESSTKPAIAATSPIVPKNTEKNKPLNFKEQEIIPKELFHLINLHHPELTQHPGLYELHPQTTLSVNHQNQESSLIPNNHHIKISPIRQNFGLSSPSLISEQGTHKNKFIEPHIKAQKNDNGEITSYHIHTSQIPNSPQQIQELLAHITQHDPNVNSFHHYPPPLSSSSPINFNNSPNSHVLSKFELSPIHKGDSNIENSKASPLPSSSSSSSSSSLSSSSSSSSSLSTHLNHQFIGTQAPIDSGSCSCLPRKVSKFN